MLGDPTEKSANMSTDMHFNIQRKHKHSHNLSYSRTYVAPLLAHSPQSLSVCEKGENAKDRKGGQCKMCTTENREEKELY